MELRSTPERIRARIALRTRLRRARRVWWFIAHHRPLVGLRRAITYCRWQWAPTSRRLMRHEGTELICRFGPGQSDIYIWEEVFVEKANDCVDLATASWIIDAGANVGYTAIWFAERYPKAQVIAIEPDTENFEILCANTAHEPRIIPVRAAVRPAGAPTQRVIGGLRTPAGLQTIDADSPGDPDADQLATVDLVDAVDIASLMERFDIEHLDLLKMDIEGAERAVFDDCADWIDRVEAIIVEVHDRFDPECSASFDRATADFPIRDIGPEGSHRVSVRRGTPSITGV